MRIGLVLSAIAIVIATIAACSARDQTPALVRPVVAVPLKTRALATRPPHAVKPRLRRGGVRVRAPHAPARELHRNVYAAASARRFSAAVAGIRPRVYVPNSNSGTVDVIDPQTFRVVKRFSVGAMPQHITPAWDMRHLYVGNNAGNSLTRLDPRTGRVQRTVPVRDPYNLYFTPGGRMAVVVAERDRRLDFRDPHTWRLVRSVEIPYAGADHLDFSADGSYLLVSTEFSGRVVRVSTRRPRITGVAKVGGLPVDVKLAPDGRVFYVANQGRGGVSVVDSRPLREVRFIRTGAGAHGLCLSRDARSLYVSNRLAGSISVIDLATRRLRRTWDVGGSPDMLQVSPDGRRLWASNRFHARVSVVDTRTGRVVKRIAVGAGPHGLTYFPQPGRYSLGHNGVYR
jgi:YVTN family beta-propeller protein